MNLELEEQSRRCCFIYFYYLFIIIFILFYINYFYCYYWIFSVISVRDQQQESEGVSVWMGFTLGTSQCSK